MTCSVFIIQKIYYHIEFQRQGKLEVTFHHIRQTYWTFNVMNLIIKYIKPGLTHYFFPKWQFQVRNMVVVFHLLCWLIAFNFVIFTDFLFLNFLGVRHFYYTSLLIDVLEWMLYSTLVLQRTYVIICWYQSISADFFLHNHGNFPYQIFNVNCTDALLKS